MFSEVEHSAVEKELEGRMLAGPRLYVGSCHTASYPLEPFGRRSCLSSRIDPRAGCLPSFPLGRHSIGRKASAFSLQPPTSSMPQLPWTLAQGAHPRCPHRQILVEHDILWLVAVVTAPVLYSLLISLFQVFGARPLHCKYTHIHMLRTKNIV